MTKVVKAVIWRACTLFIAVKWYFLGDYYNRLAVQARYLYRQSDIFKERYQVVGLDYAEETFDGVSTHFFKMAKKEHIFIRGRILLDSILKRPVQPYVMSDDSIF